MSIYTPIMELIESKTGISNTPDSITIERGEDSIWKAGTPGEILLSVSWFGDNIPDHLIEEPPDNATELERIQYPNIEEKQFISVDSDDPTFLLLDEVLQTVDESIDMNSGVTQTSLSASPNLSKDTGDSDVHVPWEDELTGDFGGFVCFEVERELSTQGDILFSAVENALQSKFDTDEVESISEVELLFSDFEYNECGYCKVTFETTDPSEFFDATVEEYARTLGDDDTPIEDLLQETYELDIRLDIEYEADEVQMGREYLDTTVAEQAEAMMESVVFSSVEPNVTAPMEGESILLTPEKETISWWMRPQIS